MINKKYLAVFMVITIAIFITGCVTEPYQVPTLEVRNTETNDQNTTDIVNPPEVDPRFTIQSDSDLREPVSMLYQAYFQGESPVFVEENADLLVYSVVEEDMFQPNPPSHFLPGAALIPQADSDQIDQFIDFALSVEGQRLLISEGFLPEMITLTDQAGNQVDINLPVARVISAYGPVTSIVYSVDGEEQMISASYLGARDPLGSSVMEKMDPRFPGIKGDDSFSQSEFNIEEAATLDPDLIIANARSSWLESAEQINVPIFLYDAENPEKLKEAALMTGQIFGPNSSVQAQAWVHYFEAVIERIGYQVSDVPEEDRLNVLFTGTEPLRVASGEMFQSYIIDAAGGNSVTTNLVGYWNNVNMEQVVIWDPVVIIVPPYGGASVEAITDSPEWQILDAVKEGRVYRMPKLVAPWDTPSPDAVLGIIWMAQQLYPEQVDLDCATEAEYFYQTFFDYEITEEELGTICSID